MSDHFPRAHRSVRGWHFLRLPLVALAMGSSVSAQIRAFPGAEGFGSASTGGRGGDVYIVTNRNASGAGSFAEAVQTAPVAGRTIVFAVSGHIRLPSGSGGGLSISKSNITVAGQTAPGDGICFWNNTMNLTGDDLVIRNIRWRYGKQTAGGDAVDISGSRRIILDHCEVMFSTDENLSSFGTPPEYFTFQWSINAWGLSGHSAGGLWDVDHATCHHSLWANNHTRNPKLIAPAVFDWTNNVTFGWNNGFNMAESPTGGTGYIHRVNVRGSTFDHGASTGSGIYGGGLNADGSYKFKLHMSDSALDGNNNGVLDVSKSNYQIATPGSHEATAVPWPQTVEGSGSGAAIGIPVTVDERLTAYKKVLSKSGAVRMEYDASRPLRDEISQLCVTRVAARQRGIIADPMELGLSTGTAFASLNSTTAPADADKDGMPDLWESALGMNPAVASHNTVFAGSGGVITTSTFFPPNSPLGYTHLEEYLHFKSQPHVFLPRNTPASPSQIDIDLTRYTSGFTASPVFTVSGASGGAVTQSGTGGRIARFVPTPNSSGRAGFDFTVTDAAGSTWTQRFLVLVTATSLPRDLFWVGNGSSHPWDQSSPLWSGLTGSTAYSDGDFVRFDDTGSASPAIVISGTLQPSAMVVDASARDYIFQGGNLSGGMSLTKRGSSTLSLRSNHAFTGGTIVEEGPLVLGMPGTTTNNTGNIGAGPLTLLGTSSVTNGWVGTQLPLSAALVIPAGSTPVIHTGRNLRLSGALTGAGTLTLMNQTVSAPGVNTFEWSGAWSAFTGTLRVSQAGGANLAIRTIFNGGAFNGLGGATLELDGAFSINPVTNSGGNTFSIGSLTSTSELAVLNGGTSGAPNYTIGALNTSTTYPGKIQGNARLTKVGSGTLTLTGISNLTGATQVNAGALHIDGSHGTSAVSVASGATLGGGGTLGGSVTASSGAIIDPAGDLSTGALNLTANTLRFRLDSVPGGDSDQISANGAVTLSGAHAVEIEATEGFLTAGIYPLITTTGLLNSATASFSHNLVNTPRQTFAIVATTDALNLVVTGSPVTLDWSGAQTAWDIATTSSWLNQAAADVFHDGDAVRFTDAASAGNISIAAPVSPRSVLVQNSTARSFSIGGAALSGDAMVTKSGTGNLTFTAANSFNGGLRIEGGTVLFGNATANAGGAGSGTVTLAGGVLRMFSAGNNTHAGTMPNALHVESSGRLEVAPRCGFSGRVTGSGTLEYRTNYVRADVTGDWSGFSGLMNVTTTGSGDFRIASNYAWAGLPQAAVNLSAGTYFYMSGIVNNGAGTTIRIGSLGGAANSFFRGGPTGSRTLTYRIGERGTDATFLGKIDEQFATTTTAIVKTGGGIWSLGGQVLHRGKTQVEAGTLRLISGGILSNTAAMSVASGATFALEGGSVSVESLTIEEGGTFTSTGGSFSGDFQNSGVASVGSGTLSIQGNVTNYGTLRVTGGAQLMVAGSFTNTGILDLLTSGSALPENLINSGIVIANTERRILSAARDGQNFQVTIMGHAGHSYQLERAPGLAGPWTSVGAAVAGNGELLVLSDPGGASGTRGFYRVSVSP
ncbi:MAG: autotransporter-associated beta strand repeat-containing protein [Akkermansiaceae bacterium]|nr:autotransporter-associated beta strand repeat-containing protein [Akkermansiaceae bacterium]